MRVMEEVAMDNCIEMVSRGGEFEINIPAGLRRRLWLITMTRRDGMEKHVLSEGRCFTFMRQGFLVKVRNEWRFYNAEAELVAVRTKAEIGTCTNVSLDFYAFEKDGVGDLWIDAAGNDIGIPKGQWLEVDAKSVFQGTTSALECPTVS